MTLAQLQRETQLGIGTVRRYWHSSLRFVSLDTLERLAEALQVDVAELVARESRSAR